MWVFIRRLLTIIAYCLINQRFQYFFRRDWNLSLVNILPPTSQTGYVNTTKMLIVWMIFGGRLLSSFPMSTFFSFLKCLRYTANRHTQVWKITTQVWVYDRLGATYFLTLAKSQPLFGSRPILWAQLHTSLQGVKRTVQMKAVVPTGMARKTKSSPSAKMLKSTPLVQLSAVNCRRLC